MKKMKKVASLLLTMIMVLAMALPVAAAEVKNGTITINNAVVGQTYKVYQILDLESYNRETNAYAYKASETWNTFINQETIKDVYVNVDAQGYVTWKEGAKAADFAKLAQAYAKEKKITPSADAITATSATVKFENLDLGYYLVDTTLGTICSLDTTNPDVEMEEKNQAPTIEKKVQEDSTEAWGATNDADMKQTVNYQATITVQAGAENYVVYDKMSSGLTFNGDVKVYVGENEVASSNYTVAKNVTVGEGENAEIYTFSVAFDNTYIASLAARTEIVVKYSATLNENAVVGLAGNPNDIILKYGDENQPSWTPEDTTITYTWDVDVLKYANGDRTKKLEGVTFVLLNKDKDQVAQITNGKLVGWVKITEGMDLTSYQLTTDTEGKIAIDGLDADTYYLRELAPLPGFNRLSGDVEVVITGAVKAEESDSLTYQTKVIEINNQSGTELPETGGTGTTILYIVGGALVLIAGVLMITKKRMKDE